MSELLEELREKLKLEYISDIRFYADKRKIFNILKDFLEKEKYPEDLINEAKAYILG